jgi:hypothetical protein
MFDLISEIDCKGIDIFWIYQMLTAFFDVVCLILANSMVNIAFLLRGVWKTARQTTKF